MNIRSIFSAISFLRTQAGSENKESAAIDSNQNINNDSLGQVTLTSLDRALVVVDIGCRWGFAERFTKNVGYFRVYGFDPDKVECQRLNDLYKSESVTLVPLGLAQTAGKRTLYITKEPACSSLLEPDPMLTSNYPALNCAQHVSSVEVETTTLDIWTKESCIDNVDYIKVDTQGSELEILTGGINTLKGVRSLEVEVEFNPIYLGQPTFSDVDIFLRDQGFVLWKLTNQVHYSHNGSPDEPMGEDAIYYDDKHKVRHQVYGGQLYWANAHYIKKDVLSSKPATDPQMFRDIALFNVLGALDVVQHIQSLQAK